jgi:DNA-directed RNA polymerase II subunit RPB1
MGDRIIGVQFGIANPEEILARSVVEVKTDKTYQSNQPFAGGVFDRRFGVTENGQVCPTCKQTNLLCPGHFGHIRLARPVYLYQFLDIIQKILTVVCLNCANPYLSDDDLEDLSQHVTGMDRLKVVHDATDKLKPKTAKAGTGCPHCGTPAVRKLSKKEGKVAVLQAYTYEEEAEPMILQPEMVLRCFQRMSDKHVELIGFNAKFSRPDWMICTVLAVPPLTVRPSVIDDNARNEDDLTHKLIDIVRNNNRLRDKIDKGESADMINQSTELLQFDVATYVDNDIKGLPPAAQRSGRPLKTLKARLGAKTGRVRGNLMGKRVDFSARSVITPDANIDLDELGVPEEIAMNLTFPEMVTPYNRDRLMSYVRNGHGRYPGAKSVELRSDKRNINLKYVNPDMIDLKQGDVVHRHLIDGDVVLFNRQPSLHKASMMCHKIRVLPYSTFRLNVSATKPYNADFDGDEMNMHVPQSIAAATELKVIASILRQIISPRTCSPIIQVFQDTLTGVFRMSKDDVSIPEHIAMNMLSRTKRPLGGFKRLNRPMTGKDVISYAFPLVDFNGNIKVENGKLVKGLLHKGAFGSSSILQAIYNEYGPERAGEFINAIQAIVSKFNLYSGFSTGPSDLVSSPEVNEAVRVSIDTGKRKIADLLSDVHGGKFMNESGRSDGEELETRITNCFNEINTNLVKTAIDILPSDNRMIEMSDKGSGAKGNAVMNLTQMIASLGLQFIEGRRVQYTMDNRTLPHFAKYDDGAESRGFVENSFIAGIRPAEFFYHAMAGREGLIDTAVKTSDTGYIQRRLVKIMEDIHVDQDRTVRDVNGGIVQYAYGDDGIDTASLEKQECELGVMTMEQVYREFATTRDQYSQVMSENVSDNPPDLVDQLLADRDILVKHILRYENETALMSPVNLVRVIQKYTNKYATKTDLTPEYVVESLTGLMDKPFMKHNSGFHILLRYYLAPKKSIINYRFTKAIFDELMNEIKYRYLKALVHQGEMVGPLAAQSIGEPTTQLTLNTFHKTGTAKANATQGVPRIQELLDISMSPKNPSNVVFLKGDLATSKDGVISKMKDIQKTTLREITKSVRIYYDPNPLSTDSAVQEDRESLLNYEKFSVTQGQSCASPWILRLELDRFQMGARGVTDMTVIQTNIQNNKILRVFDCVSSNDQMDKILLRITFPPDIIKNALSLRFIEDKLLDTVLTGVTGIGRVFHRELKKEIAYDVRVGGYVPIKQYVLDTEGTNLLDLFRVEGVDATKTFSNDIHEILDVFGIETARMALFEEINEVFNEEKVNYHHLCVLIDAMTYYGRLIPITRSGMAKLDVGVLARSSFEMTYQVLFDAAVSGDFDKLTGVSSNIMFGQQPPCGTGFVDILVDETKLPEGLEEEDTRSGDLAEANAMVEQEQKKDEAEGACRLEEIEMSW